MSATESPEDIVLVYNPDVACDCIDTEDGWAHSDFFQVKWSGYPHRVRPGDTRRMPRYLAEHFAKHLADHMLQQMELKTGRKGLIGSPVERPKVLTQILTGVEQYYHEDLGPSDEGARVSQEVDLLNEQGIPEKTMDLGTIPNKAVGVLTPEPPVSVEQVLQEGNPDPETVVADVEPMVPETKRSREELMAECVKMGIEITGKENAVTLQAKLNKF